MKSPFIYQNTVCILCAGQTNHLAWCESCNINMQYHGPRCPQCARPLAATSSGLCGVCIRYPPIYSNCKFLYLYQYPCNKIIYRFKYGCHAELANSFANYFKSATRDHLMTSPDAIVAVPLHRKRQRQRGFNQSSEFAKKLAKLLNIRFIPNAMKRVRHTKPQTKMSGKERRTNLKNAFSVCHPLRDINVILVDDVITTGSTANEVARTLKREGVKDISLWVIARNL